jgi:molybdate transport system substrate-binding protein
VPDGPRRTRAAVRAGATTAGLLAGLVTALAGCATDASAGPERTLTVFAAASLTAPFTAIGDLFEDANPGITVRFSFDGSATLAMQILEGAPADVFAAADGATMDQLGAAAINPRNFATNTLEIAVPPGNPAGITSFHDLATPGITLVICAPEVPCGAATAAVAAATGVVLDPVSREQNVTDVLGKVISGEADAGVVYRTDVMGAGDSVQGVSFPEAAAAALNTYPIAVVHDAANADLAQAFVDFVLGPQGQATLTDAGFGAP